MGLVHHGIHKALALDLKAKYNLEYFVETGTHTGASAAWAARRFSHVYTIEINARFHRRARRKHGHLGNVEFVLGDSRDELESVLSRLDGPALLWLDAHWSADLKYERPRRGECPLLAELAAVRGSAGRHVVMIDDARQFTGRPPPPHDANQWPTFEDIKAALPGYGLQVRDDVIVGVPK